MLNGCCCIVLESCVKVNYLSGPEYFPVSIHMQSPKKHTVELSSVNPAPMDNELQMGAIDEEIAEIEELINLQRRKVELLRKKNGLLKKGNNDVRSDSPISGPEATPNPLQNSRLSGSVKFADTEKPNPTESGKFNDGTRPTESGKFGGSSSSAKQLSLISSMQRMSRLSTDLANERNLLAWGRTALAAARTSLAFLGLTGNNNFGVGLVYTTSIGFGVIAVWMMLQGGLRYKQIKGILLLPEPPVHFDRLSNLPVNVILVALLVLMVIANSADSWSH